MNDPSVFSTAETGSDFWGGVKTHHGVRIGCLPNAYWDKQLQNFSTPWIGSQIKENGRTLGYRTFANRQGFQVQSRTLHGILDKMKQMQQRYGAMAMLDGYEVLQDDIERTRIS